MFTSLGAIDNGRYLGTPGAWSWVGLISFSMIVSFGVWGMPQLVTRFYSIRTSRVLKLGTVLATAPDGEGVITAEIDFDQLGRIRSRLPSLEHRRDLDRLSPGE